jgi:hypothetical protein
LLINAPKSFDAYDKALHHFFTRGGTLATLSSSRPLQANRRGPRPNAKPRGLKEKRASAKRGGKAGEIKDKSPEGKSDIAQSSERIESTNRALFPGEDHTAYTALHDELKKLYRPETPLHVEVVARVTALIWRLRRIPAFETAVFNATARSVGCPANPSHSKLSPEAQSADLGLVLSTMLKDDALCKIAQYEATLREQLKLAYRELEEINDWHFRFGFERGSIDFVEQDAPADPSWLVK